MRAVDRRSIGDAANSVGDNPIKDLADDLRELAAPIPRGEKVADAVDRAASLCGLNRWRVFNVWYGKAKSIEPAEIAAVAAALAAKRRREQRNELHELRARLLALESALRVSDPEFHEPTLSALRRR